MDSIASAARTRSGRYRCHPAIEGLLVALALLPGGCAVGPDFQPPDNPAAAAGTAYTPTPVVTDTASTTGAGGVSQHLAIGGDIPAQWWTLFRSESLDGLIRAALEHSPDLAAAQAALRQARENFNAQSGNLLYPAVTGQLGAQRERSVLSTAPGPYTYTLFNASVNVSYELDLFGGNRRALEGLAALVDYQQFQAEAAALTLVSNLVITAISQASLHDQLEALREVVALEREQLSVIDAQFTAGAIAQSVVLAQRTKIAQTLAGIPPLEKSLAQTRHQLSVYIGKLPGETGMPEFRLDSLQLPQELPVTLPSMLVRQRPDIRASEALLHEASTGIGVATANLYPKLTLSASAGSAADRTGDLFGSGSGIWGLAAGLSQPLFNAGALRAEKRAAEAAYAQALAYYQSTVLGAFQNVADALRAIEYDAAELEIRVEAEDLARQSLELTQLQYQYGAVSYLGLLDAQSTYEQTKTDRVQAQAARYADTVALFQALGGGWWNRTVPGDAATPAVTSVIPEPAAREP
jgi:NodT family efflux transporter outer membrane factor (OMF) lipoprotein